MKQYSRWVTWADLPMFIEIHHYIMEHPSISGFPGSHKLSHLINAFLVQSSSPCEVSTLGTIVQLSYVIVFIRTKFGASFIQCLNVCGFQNQVTNMSFISSSFDLFEMLVNSGGHT